ncbi:MAG: FAD-binding oxidoreductase, partial [Clostridiales bacterium]|nr:FAD-binding oxidoreductase [Clostridiales bacterium]
MPYPYHKVTEGDVAALAAATSPERVTQGADISEDYYHDEMPEYGVYPPELLIEAVSADEVSKVMAYAYENNIPVTVRGSGSGLAGGAVCKYGGILLSVMRMDRIDPVDMVNMTITAQPGALLCDVADAAAAAGLFYPPDPGERTASIGGTVITNAGGMRAVRYGVTRNYVRSIEAVLPDGETVQFSSNVVKNVTGYDLKDLIIGSEGTLCVLTSVTLKLIPAPKCSHTLVVPFPALGPCIETVPKLLRLAFIPTAVEFIEKELLDIVETFLNKPFPDKSGEAYLIVMYDGDTKDEVKEA